LEFDKTAIDRLGIDAAILPKVTPEIEILGTYKNIPVTVAIGDNQASFLGTVVFSYDTILLNMGTGGQISVMSDSPFAGKDVEARPYIEGKYLLVGASLCGGRAYAVLEKFFRSYLHEAAGIDAPQYEVMARLGEMGMKKRSTVKAETIFNGTRTNPQKTAGIYGLTAENFLPENIVIAILTGMVEELYAYYDVIKGETKLCARHIMASGNGIRKNIILQQLFAEKFGMDMELTGGEEAACGAAKSFIVKEENKHDAKKHLIK
jgi:sedoheptulokinase